ncbi:hypothetical protein BJ170DRAFT_684811 [Xylariales sp. AK1849]|nr:hypothetical protein BJ170DRAFT_684811 [Xylariales sp. AK1849]
MDSISWNTVGGWAIILGGIGVYYLYTQKHSGRAAGKVSGLSNKLNADFGKDVASATAAMKKKADKALKPKPKPKPASSSNDAAVITSSDYNPAADAAASRDSDRDFAQLYSKAKSGHKFTANKSDEKKQKSVKQSRAQEADEPAAKTSAPSSTTGDADDDLSPQASPVIAATGSRDVSDMLEASSPGPSVLRLTDTDLAKPKDKKTKAPEIAETKKQRQNRQKAERKKLERQQEELERKKLEEAQRRKARIAEGRPAKDGSTSVAPKENAWTAKTNGESPSAPVQPLDTFEHKPVQKPATTSTKERPDAWLSDLPSEEEQLKMALQEADWSEVPNRKNKKTKKPGADAPTAQDKIETSTSAAALAAAPKAKAPVNGNKSKPALSSSSSFAALTPDETTDDNEVEEEWEV